MSNTQSLRMNKSDDLFLDGTCGKYKANPLKNDKSNLFSYKAIARLNMPPYPNTNYFLVRWRVLFKPYFARFSQWIKGKTAWSPKMSLQRFGIAGFTLPAYTTR